MQKHETHKKDKDIKMKKTLISTSLATALLGTLSFAENGNLNVLRNNDWNPNWMIPEGSNGQIYYGSTKSPTALTKFESKIIEFKSSATPPPQIMAFIPFLLSRTQAQEIHKHQPHKSII